MFTSKLLPKMLSDYLEKFDISVTVHHIYK